jgi:hypothetical protein
MNETERKDPIFFMLLEAGRAQFGRLEDALKAVGLSCPPDARRAVKDGHERPTRRTFLIDNSRAC